MSAHSEDDNKPPASSREGVGAEGDQQGSDPSTIEPPTQAPPGRARRTELTNEQRRAIAEMLVHDDLTRVASAVGRSVRTVQRWIELPHFKQELERQLDEVITSRASEASAMVDELCARLLVLARSDDLPIALGAVKFGLERADKIFDRWQRRKANPTLPPALQRFLDDLDEGGRP